MNKWIVLLSFSTAFLITAGGALSIAAIGGEPTKWQIISSLLLGAIAGGKDVRSLLKLPPVADEPKPTNDK